MPWLQHEPNTSIIKLIIDNWGQWDTTARPDYDPAAVSHFDPSKWAHTGWYDDTNNNPQISAITTNERELQAGIDPTGKGPTSLMVTDVRVAIWPPGDSDDTRTGGQNLKQYTRELAVETERIIFDHWQGIDGLAWLNSPGGERAPEPSDVPLPYYWQIPVQCGWDKDRP